MTLKINKSLLLLFNIPPVTSLYAVNFLQDVYISKVKDLLGKELCLENGSHADGVEQNGKTNGFTNGSHKDEDDGDVTMAGEEEEAVKSPTASKGKGGRKSKSNADTKSEQSFK